MRSRYSVERRLDELEHTAQFDEMETDEDWSQRIEARWDAAVHELGLTMDERHIQIVHDDISDAPDDWMHDGDYLASRTVITREIIEMLRHASGIYSTPLNQPLSLPPEVCDALLAHPDARLNYSAQCGGCGYRLPYRRDAWREIASSTSTDAQGQPPLIAESDGRLRANPEWRNPLILVRPCPLCGDDDIGYLRYYRKHNRWPPAWQPSNLHVGGRHAS